MFIINGLIKDISNICESYLTKYEKIYSSNKWDNFDKNEVCEIAAAYGWLDLLMWARERNYEWNSKTCSSAALYGYFDILKWAKLNGCEWDSATCSCAAENNHFDILK